MGKIQNATLNQKDVPKHIKGVSDILFLVVFLLFQVNVLQLLFSLLSLNTEASFLQHFVSIL